MSIREEILSVLNSSEGFVSTTTLVKTLGHPRPSINSELYKMMAAKLVEKRSDDKGGNPEWKSLANDRDNIISFLSEHDKPVATLAISKHIFGPKGTAKDVNPMLYALEKEGYIVKTTDSAGTKPHWFLTNNTLMRPDTEKKMTPASLILFELKASEKPISYDKLESIIDLDSDLLFETLTDLYNSDKIIQLTRTDTDTQYWALESQLRS